MATRLWISTSTRPYNTKNSFLSSSEKKAQGVRGVLEVLEVSPKKRLLSLLRRSFTKSKNKRKVERGRIGRA